MTKTALITGASSGIGKELARYHAAQGGNLIVTARRTEALDALRRDLETQYGVTVHVIPADLGSADGPETLIRDIEAAGLRVDVLINNAGFGGHGRHIDRSIEDEQAMIDLNVKALVTLTHHFAAKMVDAGGGQILNVGSTAGFAPGPNQAVYFATKAFVASFSQAVDHELRGKGVTCTVLAPGYVETEFADRAQLGGTKLVASGGASAEAVARHGYDAMRRGKLITVNDRKLGFVMNWIIPLLPRRMVLGIIGKMQEK